MRPTPGKGRTRGQGPRPPPLHLRPATPLPPEAARARDPRGPPGGAAPRGSERASERTDRGPAGRTVRRAERARAPVVGRTRADDGGGPGRPDKPLCRGLTFNRSQRGSCSATYETPTQKQVVYEWFSARFPTNVRCVTGERAAPFPAAPRFPGRRALRTGPRSRRAAGARRAPPARPGRRTDARAARPPAGTAGDRLSEANRGSFGAAVSFRLGGILT